MNDDRLTEQLALRILGWKLAPGRFLKPDRGWTPRWQFDPFKKIEDAFFLLDRVTTNYSLSASAGTFAAEVEVGEATGKASGESKTRVIMLAIAEAIGLMPTHELRNAVQSVQRTGTNQEHSLRSKDAGVRR